MMLIATLGTHNTLAAGNAVYTTTTQKHVSVYQRYNAGLKPIRTQKKYCAENLSTGHVTCADVNCNNAGNINFTKCKIVTKKDRTDGARVNDHDERADRLSVSHENISYDNSSSCSNVFVNNVNGNCTISNGNCSISNDVIDSDTSIQCHTMSHQKSGSCI